VNFARLARVLAGFVAFFAAVQVAPLAMTMDEAARERCDAVAGLTTSLAIGLLVAGLLWLAGRRASGELFRRETIAIAAVAWFLASLLGALPFHCSGLLPSVSDAIFESVSGLTTCGGTVLGTAGNSTPEETPPSLLLWRAMLQWLGGIGIVLAFVALMPTAGAARKHLLMSEAVGVNIEGHQPRVLAQARGVMWVYVGLTAACIALLLTVGGLGWFDAVCHAFACLATGGYSTRTSVALLDSLGAEVVLTVFMYLGGCSFAVMAGALRRGWTGLGGMIRSGEFRLYTIVTALTVAAVTVDLMRGGVAFGPALRQSSFNVISMLSCCGFATADFQAWPPLSILVIFFCSVVGGCSGSAAGGLKQIRLLICLKLLAYQVRQFVQPKRVERLRLDGEVLQATTMSSVLAITLLWLLSILVGGCVIAIDQRLSFVGALSASASMLGNCGPAMAVVHPNALAAGIPALGQGVAVVGPNIGPLGGFGDLWGWTKLFMSFEMILGRLELLTLLALFTPGFWRR